MNYEQEVFQRLTAVESAVKSTQHQIDDIKKLTNSIHELASEVKYMRAELNKIQTDIDTIKSKPAKRYELIISTLITAFASGIFGFLISSLL